MRSLYLSLLTLAVVGSALAAFGIGGLIVAAVLLAAIFYIRSQESMWRGVLHVFVTLLVILFLLALLLPFVCFAREAARRMQCANQLKQIGLALHSYHQQYGCFPPAYIADENGKPMHSWRILILPFLECQKLYDRYDFNEPWDGPNNRNLWTARPRIYACPSDEKSNALNATNTNYVAVVGPETAWPSDASTRLDDFPNQGADTILVVETTRPGIHWMEPRDLTLKEVIGGVSSGKHPAISSMHQRDRGYFHKSQGGAYVAFADGRVRFLPDDIAPATLELLLTRDPTKQIDFEAIDKAALNWWNIAAVICLCLSASVLLLWPRGCQESLP